MEIIVTDRKSIEAGIIVPSAYMVISIHDPHKHQAKVRQQTGLLAVLPLAFYDAERPEELDLPNPQKLMTAQQATQVWDFIDQHKASAAALVVHCELGKSRSPAIAAAISRAWGIDESRFWQQYQPNRHVYRMLLHEHRLRHQQRK